MSSGMSLGLDQMYNAGTDEAVTGVRLRSKNNHSQCAPRVVLLIRTDFVVVLVLLRESFSS
jgi:hypothetical protein